MFAFSHFPHTFQAFFGKDAANCTSYKFIFRCLWLDETQKVRRMSGHAGVRPSSASVFNELGGRQKVQAAVSAAVARCFGWRSAVVLRLERVSRCFFLSGSIYLNNRSKDSKTRCGSVLASSFSGCLRPPPNDTYVRFEWVAAVPSSDSNFSAVLFLFAFWFVYLSLLSFVGFVSLSFCWSAVAHCCFLRLTGFGLIRLIPVAIEHPFAAVSLPDFPSISLQSPREIFCDTSNDPKHLHLMR